MVQIWSRNPRNLVWTGQRRAEDVADEIFGGRGFGNHVARGGAVHPRTPNLDVEFLAYETRIDTHWMSAVSHHVILRNLFFFLCITLKPRVELRDQHRISPCGSQGGRGGAVHSRTPNPRTSHQKLIKTKVDKNEGRDNRQTAFRVQGGGGGADGWGVKELLREDREYLGGTPPQTLPGRNYLAVCPRLLREAENCSLKPKWEIPGYLGGTLPAAVLFTTLQHLFCVILR